MASGSLRANMKLRIRGDSLRLRLTQPEVTMVSARGKVEESTTFGPTESLSYALVLGALGDASRHPLTAKLAGTCLEVTVSAEAYRAWAMSDDVGVESVQDVGGGRTLRILVEKDYACLKERPDEDDADAFPNPNASCSPPSR
jgi:hypothetical protein